MGVIGKLAAKEAKKAALVVPKRLYHATRNDFNQFELGRPSTIDYQMGFEGNAFPTRRHAIFLAEDPAFSEEYVGSPPRNMFVAGANVMPLRLFTKKPFDMRDDALSVFDENEARRLADDYGISINDLYKRRATLRWDSFDDDKGASFVSRLKKAGYDSAVLNEYPLELPGRGPNGLANVWAAFDPRQVKSAIGNRGTYDLKNPDIRYARGGRVSSFAVKR